MKSRRERETKSAILEIWHRLLPGASDRIRTLADETASVNHALSVANCATQKADVSGKRQAFQTTTEQALLQPPPPVLDLILG